MAFSGTVASFNPGKGWGYIHSPELYNKYGKDVFLHKDYMEREFAPGEEVVFEIELRDDGKPQARNIKAKGRATNKMLPPKARARASPRAPQAGQMVEQRFEGALVSFNPAKGWGYIHCPSLLQEYGKDVFLHRDYIEEGFGAAIGDSVSFSIDLRADGMPQARNIAAVLRYKGAARTLSQPAASHTSTDNHKYRGSIVSFNPKKGWGYIHCTELSQTYGKDVFLHRDYILEGFTADIGDIVSFSMELRDDGMPQARNIQKGGRQRQQPGKPRASQPSQTDQQKQPTHQQQPRKRNRAQYPVADGGRHTGTLVSFNIAKGWGYINSPELFTQYGKDVFLHRDYVEPGFSAEQGDTVSFSVEVREDGKPQARNICHEGGAQGKRRRQ